MLDRFRTREQSACDSNEGFGSGERLERRSEQRCNFSGHKLVIRERRALGILHLRSLSAHGASGITDLPVALGSIVFLELRKSRFYAAEVMWVRRLTVGVRFFRPIRAEILGELLERNRARRRGRGPGLHCASSGDGYEPLLHS